MMNLGANAEHAMRGMEGVLEITIKTMTLDSEEAARARLVKPGEYIQWTVSDTGHGMDPMTLERAFDPFFTTKRVSEGTGLGLSVVHGIVNSYGGAIFAKSAPGKGARFIIYLPTRRESATVKPNLESAASGDGKHILFIDDEQLVVNMTRRVLKYFGHKVVAETCAKAALERFRNNPERFDLVITDQSMPEISGDELAREILSIRPDTPIILCTGFSRSVDETEAKAIGIREFITKPILEEDLARAIDRALDGHSPAAADASRKEKMR